MKTLLFRIATMALTGAVVAGSVVQAQENITEEAAQVPETSQALSIPTGQENQVLQAVSSLEDEMIGYIDWENNIVYAVGDGVPPQNAISPSQARVRAKRAAIDEAYARLLETVQEVRVDAESTTRNFVNESRVVQNRVSGMVKNAEIVDLRQFEDGSYQIKMAMPMGGATGLHAALLPTQMAKIQQTRIVTRATRPESVTGQPVAAPPSVQSLAKPADTSPATATQTSYTGLIVNAQGLNASPAAFPRIIAQSGDVLYDLSVVDPNAATNGMCAYKKSLDAAKRLPRAGNNPLVVTAVDANGTNRVDLVLSDEDAEKVKMANADKDFLKNAQVIVILD